MKRIPRTAKLGLLISLSAVLIWSGYMFILRHPASYDVSLLVPSYKKIQEHDEVRLAVPQKTTFYRSKSVETQLINDSDHFLTYGHALNLEVQIDGKWYKVPAREGHYYILSGIIVYPHSVSSLEAWLDAYQCRPGHHRIIKEVSIEPDREGPNIGDASKIEETEAAQIKDSTESGRELTSQGLTEDQSASVQRYLTELKEIKKETQCITIAVEFDLI